MYVIDVEIMDDPFSTFQHWLSTASPRRYVDARWILEKLNAMEDRGHLSGDCLVNRGSGNWEVWHIHQGDYQIIYRHRKLSSLRGEVEVVEAFEGTPAEAGLRSANW